MSPLNKGLASYAQNHLEAIRTSEFGILYLLKSVISQHLVEFHHPYSDQLNEFEPYFYSIPAKDFVSLFKKYLKVYFQGKYKIGWGKFCWEPKNIGVDIN